MSNYTDLPHFKFWCQKVLPLVYEDSLSYYEILCKVVDYINAIIGDSNNIIADIQKLKEEMEIVQNWIENFDTSYAEEIIKKYIATMIFIEISDSGYIIYYIPENWDNIIFETTGLDVEINGIEYGRLVLNY